MTVIQLECFMEVVRQRNFSKAAANLYLSQPTLSRHIQSLEEELRAPLFIRTGGTTRLTAIGQALYPTLEKLYNEFRSVTVEVRDIVDRYTGTLRIGVSSSLLFREEFHRAIREVKKNNPDADIRVCQLQLNQVYSALMGGTVDVLLSLNPFMPPSDKVRVLPLFTDRMCIAVPAEHRNAGMKKVNGKRLSEFFSDVKIHIPDAASFESELQDTLNASLRGDFEDVNVLTQVPAVESSMENIMLMVESGMSATFINENSSLSRSSMVKLIPLYDEMPDGEAYRMVTIGAYWTDKNYNKLLKAFLNALREQFLFE